MKKKKKLSIYITKIFLLCAIGLAVTIGSLELIFKVIASQVSQEFCILAESLVRPDYENISLEILKHSDGWIEVLDVDLNVIYTKGDVKEYTEKYTVEDILKMMVLKKDNQSYNWGLFFLHVNRISDENDSPYYVSYVYFEDDTGQERILLSKVDREKVTIVHSMFFDMTGQPFDNLRPILYFIFLYISAFLFFMGLFFKYVKKRISKPLDQITWGMSAVKAGDLNTSLDFDTDIEFEDIKETFNLMTKQLKQAEIEKEIYEKDRNELYSNIAHDLKTPMTTITGYSKALIEGFVTSEATQKTFLEAIHMKSIRINELIDLVFTYSKLTHQGYLNKQEKDLIQLIRENIAVIYADFEQKGIDLDIDLPDKPVMLDIDCIEFSRAIYNLLSNALKHNIKGTKVLVDVSFEPNLSILIADTGQPIDPELEKDMFKPFVLGEKSRSTQQGTGLGLAIAKKVIEKHGATIQIIHHIKGYTKGFLISFDEHKENSKV